MNKHQLKTFKLGEFQTMRDKLYTIYMFIYPIDAIIKQDRISFF